MEKARAAFFYLNNSVRAKDWEGGQPFPVFSFGNENPLAVDIDFPRFLSYNIYT